MPCCCVGTDTIQKALAIAAIALIVGAADSVFRPVVEKVDTKALQSTNIEDLRAKQAAKGGAPAEPSKAPTSAPADATLGYEISIAQGHSLFELGIPFLDARHDEDFEKGHVAGAIRVAADEYPARANEFAQFAPGPVVIYCSGGQCDASHNLAKLLQQAGFSTLHVMTDGYPGWEQAGHPTAKGSK